MDQSSGSSPPGPTDSARPGSGELSTAMAHFYRGEISRSNAWRARLDATTNWAVVTTGAGLTFAFGAIDHTPIVVLIVTLLVLLFLFIEARRYRYYELWTHRARLLERNYLSPLLSPDLVTSPDWRARLTESLRRPAFPISLLEALGRRYRRNYAPLFLILALSWVIKVYIHPHPPAGWAEFLERAALGPVPGLAVLAFGVLFNGALVALGLFTVGLQRSDAEVLEQHVPRSWLRLWARLKAASREALELDLGSFKPSRWLAGGKQLVYVISDEFEDVARVILKELDRGVTLIRGTGMYSGREHGILLCVVRSRQAERLRRLVQQEDPRAFVVTAAVQDVRGEGFQPLEAP